MFPIAKSPPPKARDALILPGALPSGGVNFVDTYEGMPPNDAIALINFRPTTRGISMRKGFRTHAEELPGEAAVPTIMSYFPSGTTSFPAADFDGYLFAATSGDVYDVTGGGAGPWTGMLPAPVSSDFWHSINFQNAGGNFLLATNEAGGYYWLNESDITAFTKVVNGASPGEISNVDPDLFCSVMVWKQRPWFIEKESTRAWYLPVAQITGAATQFDFGPHFPHGGNLAALVNWTIDGGSGIDDYLVAVSSEGDVVIFKGYDPDEAGTDPDAFQLHGVWYAGSLPSGRRVAKSVGGDVLIITTQGLVQVSRLVAMANLENSGKAHLSAKVDPFISRIMKTHSGETGWYVGDLPSADYLFVGMPEVLSNQGPRQLVMTTPYKAWSIFEDLPVSCVIDHDHFVFGGASDGGKVYLLFDDSFDACDLDGLNGVGIFARATGAYSTLDSPGMFKVANMLRPTLVYYAVPEVSIKILADFRTNQGVSVATISSVLGGRWNQSHWNGANWFGELTPIRKWSGVTGSGYSLAAQIDIQGAGGTELVSIDWWVRKGGPL